MSRCRCDAADRVADVDQGRGVRRAEEPAGEPARRPPSDSGDQAASRQQREHAREQQRQPHGAHPAEPVGHHAPDRLAQAVDQEVGARGADDRRPAEAPRSCAIATSIGGIANRSSVLTKVVSWSSRRSARRASSRGVVTRLHQAGALVQRGVQHVATVRSGLGRYVVRSRTSVSSAPRSTTPSGTSPSSRVAQPLDVPLRELAVEAQPARGRPRDLLGEASVDDLARRSRGARRRAGGRRRGAHRRRPRRPCRGRATAGRAPAASRTQPRCSAMQLVAGVEHRGGALAGEQRLEPAWRRAEGHQLVLVAGHAERRRPARTSPARSRTSATSTPKRRAHAGLRRSCRAGRRGPAPCRGRWPRRSGRRRARRAGCAGLKR